MKYLRFIFIVNIVAGTLVSETYGYGQYDKNYPVLVDSKSKTAKDIQEINKYFVTHYVRYHSSPSKWIRRGRRVVGSLALYGAYALFKKFDKNNTVTKECKTILKDVFDIAVLTAKIQYASLKQNLIALRKISQEKVLNIKHEKTKNSERYYYPATFDAASTNDSVIMPTLPHEEPEEKRESNVPEFPIQHSLVCSDSSLLLTEDTSISVDPSKEDISYLEQNTNQQQDAFILSADDRGKILSSEASIENNNSLSPESKGAE